MENFESKPKTHTLQFSITEACDSRCVYCNFWKIDKPKHFPLKDIDRLFATFDYENIKLLCITGGEPTEHPEIKEIIKRVSDKIEEKVLLSTNCLNYERLKNIIDDLGYRIHTISTSLDGNKEVHDTNRGINGAYDNVFKCVRLAESKGISTKFAITVIERNIKELESIINYFGDKKVDVKTAHISKEYYGNNSEKVNLKKENLGQEIYRVLKSYYLKNDVINLYDFYNSLYVVYGIRPPCSVALTEFFVFPNGDLYSCYSKEKLGNYKELNKKEFDRLRFDFYNKHKNCNDCFARCSSSILQIFDKYYQKIADEIVELWRKGESFPEKKFFDKIRKPIKENDKESSS